MENLHGDGGKNERVCVYFTITAAHNVPSCSCHKLKSQSVISGWLNHHLNHCTPHKSPSGVCTKISITRKNREFKLLLAQALPEMCYQAPSQSSALRESPSLTLWNKNNSLPYCKQCSRPQRDSNLKRASQQDVHSKRLVSVAGKWEVEGSEVKLFSLW